MGLHSGKADTSEDATGAASIGNPWVAEAGDMISRRSLAARHGAMPELTCTEVESECDKTWAICMAGASAHVDDEVRIITNHRNQAIHSRTSVNDQLQILVQAMRVEDRVSSITSSSSTNAQPGDFGPGTFS